MSLRSWLQNLRAALTLDRDQRFPPRWSAPRARTHRPRVEILEDRCMLSLVGPTPWDGSRGISAVPAPYPIEAELNNDGRLDLVEWNYDFHEGWNTVNVFLRQGNGSYSLWQTLQFFDHPSTIYIGDIDASGLTDLVYTTYDAGGNIQFQALLNDGDWGSVEPPPPPDLPELRIDNGTVTEGNAGLVPATFNVSLSAPSSHTVTVAYTTGGGDADGSDYLAASGTLTFAPGETSKPVTVQVRGDTTFEPTESFVVYLGGATGATIADGQGFGTIVNDDVPLPSLNIDDVFQSEGRSGTTAFTFTVRLSAPSSVPVTVQFATANGTAKVSSGDYYAKSGTLTFQPGQISKTVTVSVRGDRTREADETFFLNLANSQGAWIGDGQGLGMIENDDGAAWAALINDLAFSQTSRKHR